MDAFIEIFSPVTSKVELMTVWCVPSVFRFFYIFPIQTKRRRISTLHAHENSLRSLDLSDTSGPVPTPGETLSKKPVVDVMFGFRSNLLMRQSFYCFQLRILPEDRQADDRQLQDGCTETIEEALRISIIATLLRGVRA